MKLLLFITLSTLTLSLAMGEFNQSLIINTTGQPPLNNKQQTGFMDQVSKLVLNKVGYRLKTIMLPAERGLKNVNAGIDDGEMSRVRGIEKKYPNLIRINESIMKWEFVVFSKRKLKIRNWQDLSKYSVAFINGWKILEANVPSSTRVTKVRNGMQLFLLLARQRVDLIIYEKWGGLSYLQANSIKDIVMTKKPLAIKEMFIYLNVKHRSIVSSVAQAMSEIKQNGEYAKIYNRVLKPLEPKE